MSEHDIHDSEEDGVGTTLADHPDLPRLTIVPTLMAQLDRIEQETHDNAVKLAAILDAFERLAAMADSFADHPVLRRFLGSKSEPTEAG